MANIAHQRITHDKQLPALAYVQGRLHGGKMTMNDNVRPLHPSVDPSLKRIAPQFGWGDEFVKQLEQIKPGSAVDFGRHGVFIKREDGLWDMYSGYTGKKLEEPVKSDSVDFYTKFGMHGLYEPKTEKELVEPMPKKKKHEPER